MQSEKRIKISYEIITPESAEQGDAEERGWYDEEGILIEVDKFDKSIGMTIAEKAADTITQHPGEEGFQASCSDFYSGIWYTAYKTEYDYETGAVTNYSFHLYGFTEDEERAIYNILKGRK